VSGGAFDGLSATGKSTILGAGRVQVDFWDPEAGYYLNGTYYGGKNLLAVGVAGQVQGSDDNDQKRNAYSVDFNGKRNGAVGPGFFNFDARVSYGVKLGSRRVEVFGDIFNLTNRTNFANPSGNQQTGQPFLLLAAYNTSYAPRKLQLGARFVF